MSKKLNRESWAAAVKKNRALRVKGQTFVDQLARKRKTPAKSLSGKSWQKRVSEIRRASGGGRQRGLSKTSNGKKARQVGGMLRSSMQRQRSLLTEEQRKNLPKTGHEVPKKGINASSWTYNHRKVTEARRAKAAEQRDLNGKKGINSEKWHYDHQKAQSVGRGAKGRPTTHVSAEKRRTQKDAIAKHQPKQPTPPERPRTRPKPQAPRQAKGK